ncbi:MAG: hypothetical protein CM1200mP9_10110 [Gammaproteobacteria bacterium]|nr:MAG: hypothetical protein CM1200mP9_10110 [Gammaproteobacteria bacterium]
MYDFSSGEKGFDGRHVRPAGTRNGQTHRPHLWFLYVTPFSGSVGALHNLWMRWREQIEFLVVYIREAHPEDGWVVTSNRTDDIRVSDPTTTAARTEVATACALRLEIQIPL